MPNPITWGHLLVGLALLAGLYAAWQLVTLARYRGAGHGRGTPGYARARDARRYGLWSIAAAALLAALGCLTPLCTAALS
ncbi:MAG: hypothetical protein JOZ90_16140 [Alphaproteobacteria bacterium]|nr:hypothetical protein [Alphaproteobacteria bacterium]MBV9373355.1 hypothetical protein [Alphaproteobacteria bacterium]MBV9902604.1 hypothetical protein [Alphaproteobacteria bacterium]